MRDRKKPVLDKLERLLDVAGTETPWGAVRIELRKMRFLELNALLYRIERAIAEAYETGERAK